MVEQTVVSVQIKIRTFLQLKGYQECIATNALANAYVVGTSLKLDKPHAGTAH